MKLYKDILLLLTLTGLLWSAVGCSGVIYDNYSAENDPEDPNLVTLVLNVGLVSPTRAVDVDNDREAMHSLRIVLLNMDDKGKVEYNRFISFDQGIAEYNEDVSGYQYIRTIPGRKKIFLIANEEGAKEINSTSGYTNLTGFLNSVKVEYEGFETLVKSIYFTPGDYNGFIPLTSSYTFEVEAKDVGSRVVLDPFYLVHAATKFEFEFINNRSSDVQIDELSISSIANNMYLMANFGENTPAEEKQGPDGQYWINWLKEVSKKTTDNPDDPENEEFNKQYDWIKDYQLPPNALHMTKTLVAQTDASPKIIPATARVETPLDVVYCPESKYIPSGGTEQEYSFSITLTDTGSGSWHTFENLKLSNIDQGDYAGAGDNLVTLFRNTHVKITCTIGYDAQDIELILRVGICPWTIEEINIPAFD